MALSAPRSFPLIRADEIHSGREMYARILRKLAEQQVYDYVHGQPVLSSWGTSWNFATTDEIVRRRPNGGAGGENGALDIGTWVVPPAHSYPNLRLHVKYGSGTPGSTSPIGVVVFKVLPRNGAQQGDVYQLTLPATTLEMASATLDIPAPGEGYLVNAKLYLSSPTEANAIYVVLHSVSAWFKPPTANELGVPSIPTQDGSYQRVTQTGITAGQPASAHILRWIWESQFSLWAGRPRPAFFHSYQKNWTDQTATQVKATYRFHNPDRSHNGGVDTLNVRVGCRAISNGAGGFAWRAKLYVDGVANAISADQTATTDIRYVEFVANGGGLGIGSMNAEHDYEIRIETTENGKRVDLCSVAMWLPVGDPYRSSGETVPSTFKWLPFEVLQTGTPLHEATDFRGREIGLESLVSNVYYLLAYRNTLGFITDWLYRWNPFGARNTNPRAYWAIGDDAEDTGSFAVPWDDQDASQNRYQVRMRLPCAEDITDRRTYRYWLGISRDKSAQQFSRMEGNGGPQHLKLRHGAWTSESLRVAGEVAGDWYMKRPNILWTGPHESTVDIESPRTSPNVSLLRAGVRVQTGAAMVCGSLIMPAPRTV